MLRRIGTRAGWIEKLDASYWLKALLVSIVLGAAAAALHWTEWLPAWLESLIIDFQGPLAKRMGLSAGEKETAAPAVLSPMFGLLAGLMAFGTARLSMPFLWPGPPDILQPVKLDAAKGADHPEFPERPLVGRDEEMSALMRFAGPGAGDLPRWTSIDGPMGVGKTSSRWSGC